MKELRKELLHMLKRLLVALLFSSASSFAGNVDFTGDFTQGGMVIAVADSKVVQATVDGVKIPVHPDGKTLVFGYGRDAKVDSVIDVEFTDGTKQQKRVKVKQRDYKVDKVNGVAKKYVSPPESVLARIRNDSAMVKKARSGLSYRQDYLAQAITPAKGRISGVYGSQRVFNGVPKRPHFGMDIAAATGTKVIAPWAGQVVLAEPDLYYSGGTLIIDHGMGITSTYIHLSKLHVKVGDQIKAGERIAEIGATGRVTGPHLDWRLNWFNRRLDPQLLLE